MDPREKYTIPNLRNACRVLKYLTDISEGVDLKTLSGELKIPRTTALRVCTTLELENFLRRTEEGKYVLGSGLAPLGMRALPNVDIRKLAVPVLNEIVKKTGETAHLAMMCGKESLILEVCDSPHALRVASRPGSLVYLHCSATGKIFISWLVPGDLRKFLKGVPLKRCTPNTKTRISDLQKESELVREQGYAVDEEEYSLGIRCLAVPVWNSERKVIAAIGLTGAAVRFTPDRIVPVAEIMTSAAIKLSKSLGPDPIIINQPTK